MSQPTQNFLNPASPGAKANLISLMTAMGLPGVIGANGEVTVDAIADLNEWFSQFRTAAGLATASRCEIRNGQLFGLGGLDWQLLVRNVPGVGSVTVRAVTGEREWLPDLPVVRAGFPYGLGRVALRGVAA
jgi:hypothetical protein